MTKETKAILGSLYRVFLIAVMAQYLNSGKDIFELDLTILKTFLNAGISSVVLVGFNYLNKNDPRYGKNKEQ